MKKNTAKKPKKANGRKNKLRIDAETDAVLNRLARYYFIGVW